MTRFGGFAIYELGRFQLSRMATTIPGSLVNKAKKHFLGMPAPAGYVPGVGRGCFIFVVNFSKMYHHGRTILIKQSNLFKKLKNLFQNELNQ